MRIDRDLDDWVAVKTLWQLVAEAEARNQPHRPALNHIEARFNGNRRPLMNRIVNRPDLHRIAKDLAVALMIAGAVVLFFL